MTDTATQQRDEVPTAVTHHQRSRRTAFLIFMVVMMGLSCTQAYNINIPKVARPLGSRTRLSETKGKDGSGEKYFTARPPSKRRSSSKVAMTSAVIDHTATPTFENRMRSMVLKEEKRTTTTRRSTSNNLPRNVKMISSLQEYKHVVGEARAGDKVVVARFYAPWCKACKAVQPMFYRLATKFTNVVFVEVPVTEENAALHQGLGVPTLPYGHIYDPEGGLVEELSISRKFISQFANKLQTYVTKCCVLKDFQTASPYACDLECPTE